MSEPTLVKRDPPRLARLEPQELIQSAIDHGAGIETLERLVALAKDIRSEQAREAWHGAMAEFQRTCKPIKKSASMQVPGRKGYSYAPLDEVLGTIQPVMGALGLSVSWRSRWEAQHVIVSCRVSHLLGHHEDSGEMRIPVATDGAGANAAQRIGTATTYAKRYSLLGIIGMAPEDDDDAVSVGDRHEAVGADTAAETRRQHQRDEDNEQRDKLLIQIRDVADGAQWSKEARAELWAKHFGDRKQHQVSLAELADLLADLKTLTA